MEEIRSLTQSKFPFNTFAEELRGSHRQRTFNPLAGLDIKEGLPFKEDRVLFSKETGVYVTVLVGTFTLSRWFNLKSKPIQRSLNPLQTVLINIGELFVLKGKGKILLASEKKIPFEFHHLPLPNSNELAQKPKPKLKKKGKRKGLR